MTIPDAVAQNLIWATRGRHWGFRFLSTGGFADPLRPYERAFGGLEDDYEVFQTRSDLVAVRLPDPEGRRDASSRVIPHDMVLFGTLAEQVNSLKDVTELVWPLISHTYSELWDLDQPDMPKGEGV